ncbi:MAG: DUF1990 domain-containing protein [Candidatus Nanopelagicales bacterium]
MDVRRELTYPNAFAGSTVRSIRDAEPLPVGYRHVQESEVLGHDDATFARVSDAILNFSMHRGAGVRVLPNDARAVVGLDVTLRLGVGLLSISAPCRVVSVVDEADRRGFAYGTLAGHPESGEEAFVVERVRELGAPTVIRLRIVAFSRPDAWWARLGSPVSHRVQAAVTRRYLRSLID